MADSGASTPSRFTSQAQSAEDALKEQVAGLVQLSDFRKRQAELNEAASSGTSTPRLGDGRDGEPKAAFKKRKKAGGLKKGGLSFGNDEEEEDGDINGHSTASTPAALSRGQTPATGDEELGTTFMPKKKLKANTAVAFQPKAQTKSSLRAEAHLKDSLRREFIAIQTAVKATPFALPFVFFDGSHVPGGVCRMRKGEQVWLFLDKARKVGASQSHQESQKQKNRGYGPGVFGDKGGERKDWARIGVDDLMLVRGDLILPHHYEFYTFIADKTIGYNGILFPHSSEPTDATPKNLFPTNSSSADDAALDAAPSEEPTAPTTAILQTAADRKREAREAQLKAPDVPDESLEGFHDDPSLTKVVDRRWYERNKHIYPASAWEDFDPERDYTKGPRKDGLGNSYFFSR